MRAAIQLHKEDVVSALSPSRGLGWRFLLQALTAFAVATCFSNFTWAAGRSVQGIAPAIYLQVLDVPQGGLIEFHTESLSNGADPVMHLLRQDAFDVYTQVDVDDDISWPDNLNSSISYVNSGPLATFYVVIRAWDLSTLGTCNVLRGSVLQTTAAPVGGWFMLASTLTYGAGDELRTVMQPGGSVQQVAIKFNSNYSITGMGLGNAVAGSARLGLTGAETHLLVGTPWLHDGLPLVPSREGSCVLMANDIASDSAPGADGDGVGNQLELALGTCPTIAGCPMTNNGKDTDRDGLFDGEEIFGVAGVFLSGVDDLPFARRGANPLKKDVFIEVDWLTTFGPPTAQPGDNPFQFLRDHPTWPVGNGWTGSPEDWVALGRQPFMTAPADQIKNPNGTTGLELHLDIGVDPLLGIDEDKFGDWSRAAARPIVPDFIMRFSGPINGTVTVMISGFYYSFDATGLTAEQTAAIAAMGCLSIWQPVKVKSFGQLDDGSWQTVIEPLVAGMHFTRGLSVPAASAGFGVTVGESNGSYYQHYEDVAQFDQVRRGRFRLAIATQQSGGGQSNGFPSRVFLASMEHITFFHELGHSLGLSHWGHEAWGNLAGTDCLPQYNSLMRYSSTDYVFANPPAPWPLNPAAAIEQEPFGLVYDYARFLLPPYNYKLPTGSGGVDWNRDEWLSGISQAFRAPVLSLAGGNCQAAAQGKTNIAPAAQTAGAVDLVRVGNRLYALWAAGATSTELRYKHANLGPIGNKSCTGSPDPGVLASPCLTWSAEQVLASGNRMLGVTATVFEGELFVATFHSLGYMTVRTASADVNTGTLSVLSTTDLPNSNELGTSQTPELVVRHQTVHSLDLGLLYLSLAGDFRSFGWNGVTWIPEGQLRQAITNAPITGTFGPAAKAWPDDSVTGWLDSEKRTIAILPGLNGAVNIYGLDQGTDRWQNLNVNLGGALTAAKPFVEYRSIRTTSGSPNAFFSGHFVFGWMAADANGSSRAYASLSTLVGRWLPPSGPGAPALGVAGSDDFLQNTWAYTPPGRSAALYSDSTIDNVFGLVDLAVTGGWTGLVFYPHADGSPDHMFNVYSDFRVMEDLACAGIGPSRSHDCGPVDVFN